MQYWYTAHNYSGSRKPITSHHLKAVTNEVAESENRTILFTVAKSPKLGRLISVSGNSTQDITSFTQSMVRVRFTMGVGNMALLQIHLCCPLCLHTYSRGNRQDFHRKKSYPFHLINQKLVRDNIIQQGFPKCDPWNSDGLCGLPVQIQLNITQLLQQAEELLSVPPRPTTIYEWFWGWGHLGTTVI